MSQQAEGTQQQPPVDTAMRTMDRVGELMQQLVSTASVNAAFAEPRTVGDRTIIPAAEVMAGFGFGAGGGEGPVVEGRATGAGSGGGGGGGARSRPMAVIVVEPEKVSVQPVVDVTQLGLAALSAWLIGLFWMGRLLSRARGLEDRSAPPSPRSLARLLRRA